MTDSLKQAAQKALEAMTETRRVDEIGRQPETHWESLRHLRRTLIEQQDAAIAALTAALQHQEEREPSRERMETMLRNYRRALEEGNPKRLQLAIDALMNLAATPPLQQKEERLLRAIVNHWHEFGPEHGLDEKIDAAHRYLSAPQGDQK